MKFQKIVSGLLVCAMALTSLFTGEVTQLKAAGQPEPVASYDFNETETSAAEPFAAGLEAYHAGIAASDYGVGRSGDAGDRAIQLGKFGLRLPEKNLGGAYTVSMWVNRTGDLSNFMPILFLGKGAEGQWIGLAGAYGNPNGAILWGGNQANTILSADEVKFSLEKNQWVMLTVTQKDGSVAVYKNGVLLKQLTISLRTMDGEDQRIHLGVNPYEADGVFPGLVDDVCVYNQALSAAQVRYLYDGTGEEEIFESEGFQISSEEFTLPAGTNRRLEVTLPAAVSPENAVITFSSDNTSAAAVGETDGVVRGVARGAAKITTTVKVGNSQPKTKTTLVHVTDADVKEGVAAEYDFSAGIVDGKIKDISGYANDAAVEGASGVTFTQEGGQTVMNLGSDSSYIKLPSSIMDTLKDKEQFVIETKFAKSDKCGSNAWLFCLGSNVASSGKNYLFLSPNFGTTYRGGIKGDSTEVLFSSSVGAETDKYHTVEFVFDHGVMQLYSDGVLIDSQKTNFSIMDDVVTPGTKNGVLGYIGQSCWAGDKRFQGKVASFKIHDGNARFQEQLGYLTEDAIRGKNASLSEVKYDLALPEAFHGYGVAWSAEPEGLIEPDGKVKNPAADTDVTLKATIASGALSDQKEFRVKVKAMDQTEYRAVLEEAKKRLNDPFASAASKALLQEAIGNAGNAATQTELDQVVEKIRRAMEQLVYPEHYQDPLALIDEASFSASIQMTPNTAAKAFQVPAAIKDMVTVSYTSSRPEVASVDASGVITAKKAGYTNVVATVRAKYDGFLVECQTLVKVDANFNSVTAAAGATKLAKGGSTQIAVKNAPAGAQMTYRAKGAVSVNKSGKVVAVKSGKGTVTVKITSGGKSVSKKIAFQVGEITGAKSVKVKKSITLKVTGLSGKVKWSVDKKKLASISSKGKLKAKKAGKVKVTAKVGKVTMKKTITIKK